MPSNPPTVLPSKDENEIADAPKNVTAYPPAREPRNIPIIIMVLRDMSFEEIFRLKSRRGAAKRKGEHIMANVLPIFN
jgi:hypothetical protein